MEGHGPVLGFDCTLYTVHYTHSVHSEAITYPGKPANLWIPCKVRHIYALVAM